jgi:alpha-tubulin suppressor-like RCC1 family protein
MSEGLIQDILSEKLKIKEFLQKEYKEYHQFERRSGSSEELSSHYFAPADRTFVPSVPFSEIFPARDSYQLIDDIFINIDQYVDRVQESVNLSEKLGKWVSFPIDGDEQENDENKAFDPSIVAITSVPTVDRIKQLLSDERLILSVYSSDGYNFSSEFVLIYRGNFTTKRAYENSLAVLQKAIKANDVTLSEEQCLSSAVYILDRLNWVLFGKLPFLSELLRFQFPAIEGLTIQKNIQVSHVQIYLHQSSDSSDSLSFSLRLEDDIVFTDKKNKKPEADNIMKTISYHSFSLSENSRREFYEKEEKTTRGNNSKNKKNGGKAGGEEQKKGFLIDLLSESLISSPTSRVYLTSYRLLTATAKQPTVVLRDEEKEVEKEGEKEEKNQRERNRLDLDLLSLRPTLPSCDASFCSEMIVWGLDSFFSMGLGIGIGSAGRKLSEHNNNNNNNNNDENNNNDNLVPVQEEVYEPRPLPLTRNLIMERVKLVACSSRHSLLLTHFGSVYSCGDNSEGALGLGDVIPRPSFTLVEWFTTTADTDNNNNNNNNRNNSTANRSSSSSSSVVGKIVFLAAGSGSLGSHSMAVDSRGQLYGWGFPRALGLGAAGTGARGSDRSGGGGGTGVVNTPTRITIPSLNNNNREGMEPEQEPEEEEKDREERVRTVSCGDGFSAVLTVSGLVLTMGQYSHGRLGLGPIPTLNTVNRRSAGGKRLAKYQLRPTRVLLSIDQPAVHLVCGESHVLVLLRDGSLVGWGQNSLGQVGTGPTRSGFLKDAFSPVLIAPFISSELRGGPGGSQLFMKEPNPLYREDCQPVTKEKDSPPLVSRVVCGSFHSLVLDQQGRVWSWGGRGSPCLGQGDSPLLGEWGNKISALFALASTDTERMIPFELLKWATAWSRPRRITGLEGMDITQLAAGDLHSAFLTSSGRLFLCGSGPVVPGFSPEGRITSSGTAEEEEEEEQEEMGENNKNNRNTSSVTPSSSSSSSSQVVSAPRCPSASWLKELCTRSVCYIASAGCRLFVAIDEELVSGRLTSGLYRRLTTSRGTADNNNTDKDEDNDQQTIGSQFSDFSSPSRFSSLLEERGRADCMVIASGHIFLCHRALLATRSSELRNMIIMEGPIDMTTDDHNNSNNSSGGGGGGPTLVQIFLPELNREAARALFFFLYRDSLPMWAVSSPATLSALSRVGRTLKMTRLFLLAERFLDILTTVVGNRINNNNTDTDTDRKRGKQLVDDLPPPTLVRDLGGLLGDPEFADVRFIAEGRTVAAHRFILEGRCEYFRAMFRSGMSEAGGGYGRERMIDVVVPGNKK